jgi:threonine dehydratase
MSCRAPDPDNISRAASLIAAQFINTPQFTVQMPGFGFFLLLKIETMNVLRSFKGRGTDYLLATSEGSQPVACASVGNFGQGVAWAARRRGRIAHVFTARDVNPAKHARMRALGAVVHVTRHDFDGAKQLAQAAAEREGWFYAEDGADPRLAEGAGTIAAEMEAEPRWPDVIIAPVGNGSLINGLATWAKHHHPETVIIAAGATGAPAMQHAWRTGQTTPGPETHTIADGIAARIPVPQAINHMRHLVDDFQLVHDHDITHAMRLLYWHCGIVSEPAGAAGLAVALHLPPQFNGSLIATPVCGSNISPDLFTEYVAQPPAGPAS